jgi:hypothetical protein
MNMSPDVPASATAVPLSERVLSIPHTSLGKWSMWLLAAFVLLFCVFIAVSLTLDAAGIGPSKLADYLELVPGQTLTQVPQMTPMQPVSPAAVFPQECPVAVVKVTSSQGGFGHSLSDTLTTSEYERQTDTVIHEGQERHYLDMRMLNKSAKPIRAIESVVVYSNVMGAESTHETLVSQNQKPIKPGQEYKSYFMDRSLQSANGLGDVTVYVEKIRFSDDTFWQDNGSHSCKLTSQIKR